MVEILEHAHNLMGVLGHAGAAVLGVIGANYIGDIAGLNNWTELIGGLVLFAIPTFWLRGTGSWEGPTRLALSVAGLVLMLRALVGNGSNGIITSSVNVTLPAEVASVI